MSRMLDTAANIVTLLAGLAIVAVLGQRVWTTTHQQTLPQSHQFREGDQLPVFDELDLRRSERTLLMVLRHDCQYCAESMSFYQRLSSIASNTKAVIQLVVVTNDDPNTAKRYVDANELTNVGVVSVPSTRLNDLRVIGTPTLILADRHGRVQKVCLGKLSPRGQADVEMAILHDPTIPTLHKTVGN